MAEQDMVNCKSCGHVTAVDPEDARCRDCGQLVCLHCGCTNEAPCFHGLDEGSCFWVRLGVCSACEAPI